MVILTFVPSFDHLVYHHFCGFSPWISHTLHLIIIVVIIHVVMHKWSSTRKIFYFPSQLSLSSSSSSFAHLLFLSLQIYLLHRHSRSWSQSSLSQVLFPSWNQHDTPKIPWDDEEDHFALSLYFSRVARDIRSFAVYPPEGPGKRQTVSISY